MSLGRNVLHLFALAAFAIAQPLFDVLGRTPEFLLVRRSDRLDVVLLAAVVSVGPTLVLALVEAAASGLGRWPRTRVHAVLVALLGALCVLPLVNRHLEVSAGWALGLAAVAGAALATAYVWSPGLRAFTTWLSPAGLVFPALFLLRPPTSAILFPPSIELGAAQVESNVPIVMIVFDEFPAYALVGSDGEIDATLFPNFARLAREGTWFRNATTVASMTPSAVAAILTGDLQGRAPLAAPTNRARNLFTLVGASHALNVTESYVPFCPPGLCGEERDVTRRARVGTMLYDAGIVLLHVLLPPSWASRLPMLTYASLLVRPDTDATSKKKQDAAAMHQHADVHWQRSPVERAAVIDRFITSITPSERGTLNYLHVLAPHVPYVYAPPGKVCAGWQHFPWAGWWYGGEDTLVLHQRLLMQVGWLDGMIGRLLAHLERTGLYDRTLLVLVADHGISFRPGGPRRPLTMANACDILSVPLFIKGPHQRDGGVSDRNVELIDVLPTIAELLGIAIPWPVDGQTALGIAAERPTKTVVGPSWPTEGALRWKNDRLAFPRDFGVQCLRANRPNPTVAWGTGARRIFRFGPYGALVGDAVGVHGIEADAGIRVHLAREDPSAAVAPDATEAPCLVEGEITVPEGTAEGLDLVVAINGTIEAVGQSRRSPPKEPPVPPSKTASFSIPVPPAAFRNAHNVVEVFVPRGAGASVQLVPTDVRDRPGT